MKKAKLSLENIKASRVEKLRFLRENHIDPYPVITKRDFLISEALNNFEVLSKENRIIALVGRVRSIRKHGKVQFIDIEDSSGKIQVLLSQLEVGTENFKLLDKALDEGDIIEAAGTLFLTNTNQKTIKAKNIRFLSKSLLSLPSKWHGLKNKETRYRKRYLDLILNPDVKKVFLKRSAIIKKLREILDREGFLEVETPILQNLAGGALARPFKTFLNALNIELFLRIAPELYLKRLLVGGYEKVYEIGRNFRNEGIDAEHNPEFTMIEFYWAYQDDKKLRKFTEDLICEIIISINGNLQTDFGIKKIDWSPPWPMKGFIEIIQEKTGLDYKKMTRDELLVEAKKLGVEVEPYLSKGKIADEIFKKKCRPEIFNPTFIINHPVEVSPLAKKLPEDPNLTARFQVIVAGMELVNAFSELNDPLDQEERFFDQAQNLKKGDEEAHSFDKDFIEALKYGMPPAAGFGMGIDRLTMLLTNQPSIRDVILFPFMRPKS